LFILSKKAERTAREWLNNLEKAFDFPFAFIRVIRGRAAELRKKPGPFFRSPGFVNSTPQMPFRRISRSLSVTGGRPLQKRLTSN
jgi:hypothetical protein